MFIHSSKKETPFLRLPIFSVSELWASAMLVVTIFQNLHTKVPHDSHTLLQLKLWNYGHNKMSITRKISKIFEKFLRISGQKWVAYNFIFLHSVTSRWPWPQYLSIAPNEDHFCGPVALKWWWIAWKGVKLWVLEENNVKDWIALKFPFWFQKGKNRQLHKMTGSAYIAILVREPMICWHAMPNITGLTQSQVMLMENCT